MPVHHNRPAARGVNQLMYVGDDAATTGSLSMPVKLAIAAVIGWLILGAR